MKQERLFLNGPDDRANLYALLQQSSYPYQVVVTEGALQRTLNQNALLHKWFGEVARQRQGVNLMDVKAEANFAYGKPLLTRDDPNYGAFFRAVNLTHEQTIKSYKKGFVACTSLMTTKQLSEYATAFSTDMRAEGFVLTEPETD